MDTTTEIAPGRLLIDGAWADAKSGATFTTVNPADESVIATVAEAGPEDVDVAVAAARKALAGPWAKMTAADRGKILWRMGDLIQERLSSLGLLETLDTGKTLFDSAKIELPMAAQIFQFYAGAATKLGGRTLASRSDTFAFTLKEPVGVVAAIVPWNFPFLLASWKVAPALAAGCTVILKPASQTPLSALEMGRIGLDAGLPPGVFQVLPGSGRGCGTALVKHAGVDKVAFTGSTEVGKSVLRDAAGTLKRVSVELGGKSPNIVFADADIEAALRGAFTGIFYNKGEVCAAGSRLFVERGIHEKFVADLAARADAVVLGDPRDKATRMGPVVSKAQMDTVLGYVESGTAEGAHVAAGGRRASEINNGKGYFVRPTVFDAVTSEMTIAREEIFGPVLAVLPFDDAADAVRQANATTYGLAAGVWTRDLAKAHRVARAIQAGTVWVNAYNLYDPALPFGGFKQSGFGRELGIEALDGYLETKSVWIDIGR
ncbi:MAG TPA: aldehyde dehydrogenase family protein [Candidatus Polarisedimenticolaceae bacterium]|nr:aldehyde dehydrogenase family protein [Candidatus Polarisedimenticolaceae bacterium]